MRRAGVNNGCRGSIAIGVALAVLAGAGPAGAQFYAPPPPPVVPVQIVGADANTSIEVLIQGEPVECGQRCSLSLVPGAYNLRVTDADGNLSRENLFVRGPVRATVTPANRSARIAGIVMMGVALVGAGVGAFGAVRASAIRDRACRNYPPEPNCDEAGAPWLYASAIGFGAALVFGFTGFYMWDQNKTASIDLAPLGR
jgi:hypothetical protein